MQNAYPVSLTKSEISSLLKLVQARHAYLIGLPNVSIESIKYYESLIKILAMAAYGANQAG